MSVSRINFFSNIRPILSAEEAAARYGLPPETITALWREGIFPTPDQWRPDLLDEIVERICREGIPNNSRLPYSHPVPRRLTDGRRRLHPGWRHDRQNKRIKHPLNSAPYVREWFKLERDLASRRLSLAQQSPQSSPSIPTATKSSTPAEPLHKAPPLAPKLASTTDLSAAPKPTPPPPTAPPIFVTPEELCERWRGRVAIETLSNWRSAGVGPPATRIGRTILYRLDLLEAWELQQLSPKPKP